MHAEKMEIPEFFRTFFVRKNKPVKPGRYRKNSLRHYKIFALENFAIKICSRAVYSAVRRQANFQVRRCEATRSARAESWAALLIVRVEMTSRRFVVPSLQPQGQLQRHRASEKLGFENLYTNFYKIYFMKICTYKFTVVST
jgi:hypothetical protein